jgi:hypothetical protein
VSKRKKTFTITANDIPNPVAVKALQDAASAIADRIDDTKPGMQTLKDFLPSSLLLYATSLGGFDLVMQDGTKVPVRSVDMQAAGMDMVARATGRYMSQLVGKRLADDKSLWGVAQYHRGKFVRFVDLDAHERAKLFNDHERRPSVFATRDDAQAEADSLTFLADQEEYGGASFRVEPIPAKLLAKVSPATATGKRGGTRTGSRRRGRAKPTARKR